MTLIRYALFSVTAQMLPLYAAVSHIFRKQGPEIVKNDKLGLTSPYRVGALSSRVAGIVIKWS